MSFNMFLAFKFVRFFACVFFKKKKPESIVITMVSCVTFIFVQDLKGQRNPESIFVLVSKNMLVIVHRLDNRNNF